MNQKKIILITGASYGIGFSLAKNFLGKEFKVIAVNRTYGNLLSIQKKFPENLQVILADIAEEDAIIKITESLPKNIKIKYLIHNAAIIGHIGNLLDISLQEWKKIFAINVEGPLFLTKALLPYLPGGRVLHISSGFAHMVTSGVGAYSITKNTLFKIYEFLKDELREKNISIGSIMPGVVDTKMQEHIRSLDEKIFPQVDIYNALKKNNKLLSPEKTAEHIIHLLTKTTDEQYEQKDWGIKEILNMV